MLHLCAANPMARDVNHVVYAAGDPIAPILVADTRISCEIIARVRLQIRFQHARVVAIHGPQHGWPRLGEHEYPSGRVAFLLLSCGGIENTWVDPEHWQSA